MPAFDWEKAVCLSLVVRDWLLATPKGTTEPKIPKTDRISNIASYCAVSPNVSIYDYVPSMELILSAADRLIL